MDIIIDSVLDALIDSLKLLPFLFLTYLLMEYLEEKMEDRTEAILHKAGKSGPLWGALLGVLPQCGFSAAASSFYAGRVITMGTVIAVYLSTSDEMLPIMISEAVNPLEIVKILAMKVVIGMICGFLVDYVIRHMLKKADANVDIHHFCEHEKCECGHGILMPAINHTVKITLFILLVSIVLNIVISLVGIENMSDFVLNKPIVGELLIGLIGLIPNCASSVVITELYLEGAIRFGTMMSGLLVGAGVGLLVLFKVNADKRENLTILSLTYAFGVVAGIIINLLS